MYVQGIAWVRKWHENLLVQLQKQCAQVSHLKIMGKQMIVAVGGKARAATTILSQSHPTVAHGCSCTSLLVVPQQSWPVATVLAALPRFQMLALIKRSLKSTSLWRRDIWKVNCCCSCRDQHRAERSPSDPLWALTHIWKAWDLLPCELFEPSQQGCGAVCRESTSSKLACAPVLPFSCKCFPHHIYSHQTLWAGFPLTSEGAH